MMKSENYGMRVSDVMRVSYVMYAEQSTGSGQAAQE